MRLEELNTAGNTSRQVFQIIQGIISGSVRLGPNLKYELVIQFFLHLYTFIRAHEQMTGIILPHVGRSPRQNVPAMSAVAFVLPQCFNPQNKSRSRNLIFHFMMEEIICRKKQRLCRGSTVLGALSSFVSGMLILSEVSPSLSLSRDLAPFAYFQRQLSAPWCIAPFLMCLLCEPVLMQKNGSLYLDPY